MIRRQTQQIVKDFLRMQTGKSLDAISASQRMHQQWGVVIDWHEFAYALDYLRTTGEAVHDSYSHDRFISYIIEYPRKER